MSSARTGPQDATILRLLPALVCLLRSGVDDHRHLRLRLDQLSAMVGLDLLSKLHYADIHSTTISHLEVFQKDQVAEAERSRPCLGETDN